MKNSKKESENLKELEITISDYLNPFPNFDPSVYRKQPKKIELPQEFIDNYNKRIMEMTELSLFEKIDRYIYWTNKLSSLFLKIIGALVMGNLKTTLIGWAAAILIWVGGYIQENQHITLSTFLTGAASAVLGTVAADAKSTKKEKDEQHY